MPRSRALIVAPLAAALVAALPAGAAPVAPAPAPVPDAATSPAVPSPNRQTLRTLSATSAKKGATGSASGSPVLVVDAAGKTLGRFAGTNMVMLSYEGQPMLTRMADRRTSTSMPHGFTFDTTANVLMYTSPDCSGSPLMNVFVQGTRYIGMPQTEEGVTYILVGDATDAPYVYINSAFYPDFGCHSTAGLSTFATPVIAFVPAAPLGTPPFTVK